MQTFLPYEGFKQSAEALDKKRCWKQVVEASQIINILEGKSASWKNHPAVKMWEGSVDLLKDYYNVFLEVSIVKHKINTTMQPKKTLVYTSKRPFWLGDEPFHRAMRARLIEKDRPFYLPLFPKDEGFNDGKYFWPVMETETFRVI